MVTFRRNLSRTDQFRIGFSVSPYLELCSTGNFDGLFQINISVVQQRRGISRSLNSKCSMLKDVWHRMREDRRERGEQGEPVRSVNQHVLYRELWERWNERHRPYCVHWMRCIVTHLSKHLRGTPNVHRNPRRPRHVLSSAWSSLRSHLTRTSYKNDVSRNHSTYIRPANMERTRRAGHPRLSRAPNVGTNTCGG